MVGAIVAEATRGFRGELQQRLDCAGRRLARPQFQHLSKQDQNGNDRGGLKVDRNRAAMSAEGGRKELRNDGSDQAVAVGHSGSHRDQREHVEIAREERLPAANKERPARPQHDGCREYKLDPVR